MSSERTRTVEVKVRVEDREREHGPSTPEQPIFPPGFFQVGGHVITVDPTTYYQLVFDCLSCGMRMRGTRFARGWDKPPSLDSAEHMQTLSGGPGRLHNERTPLWAALDNIIDPVKRRVEKERVAFFFEKMEQRLLAGAAVCRARVVELRKP